ncbi:MAG: MBL fold metallo-hydrolase [Alphaproteobacteria bacterium]
MPTLQMQARKLLAAALCLAAVQAAQAEAGPGFVVHRYANPMAGHLNAYLIETGAHVVVVDTGFGEIDGSAIRAMADAIGKPVAAVLLTHAHIDHYGGIGYVAGPDVPFVSGAGVGRHYDTWDPVYAARLPLPENRRRPDTLLADGAALSVDGVTITLHDAGAGESYDDVWFLAEADGQRAAFVGDIAMYGIPPFVQSGHSADWLASLARLHAALAPDTPVYLGHDSRPDDATWHPFDRGILDEQADQLRAFRTAVAEAAADGALDPAEIDAVAAAMAARADDPAYGFLAALSAPVVAAELSLEDAKAAMELQLRAVLAQLPD